MAIVGEIIRGTVKYVRLFSSEPNNVFHWELADSDIDDGEVADEIEAWVEDEWGAKWQDFASNQATITSVNVQVVNVAGEVVRNLGEIGLAVNGQTIDTTLAAATSAWLGANTDTPAVRGSKYIPGLSENELNNGAWTNETLVDLALLLVIYLSDINTLGGGTLLAGVISNKLSAFESFNNSGSVEQVPAYQRRRKPSVGS